MGESLDLIGEKFLCLRWTLNSFRDFVRTTVFYASKRCENSSAISRGEPGKRWILYKMGGINSDLLERGTS